MTISKLALEVEAKQVKDAATALGNMAREGDTASKSGSTLSSTFAKMRDVMQGPIAAVKMVVAGFQQMKAVSDKMEAAWKTQEMAVSNLEAVLKSTGGVSGMTSQQLQEMASSLQKVTTFGDETIISAQAVMLTFKEIGKDIFPDAMEAALDLSTIMGGDLKGATVMLGKALNEPIQGIGALRRVGVQLTDQQEASIKSFMDVNDLASAQAVIMGEVQSQFGGAAKAAGETSSAMKDKLAMAIGDVNEQIGRSIANNLKPWRESWLGMAKAIGASLKAQNDFTDAMARANKGTDTQEDRLLIAQDYLKVLEDSLKVAKGGGGALAEMYGSTDQLEKDIQLQRDIIRGIQTTQRYTEQANKAAAEGNKQAEAAAKIAAEKSARDTEALSLGQKAYQNVIDMEAAEQRRFKQFGEEVDLQGLSNKAWAEAEGLLAESNGLISERNPLYIRLVDLSKKFAEQAENAKESLSEVTMGEYNNFPETLEDSIIRMSKLGDLSEVVMGEYNNFPETLEDATKRLEGLKNSLSEVTMGEFNNFPETLEDQLKRVGEVASEISIGLENTFPETLGDHLKRIGAYSDVLVDQLGGLPIVIRKATDETIKLTDAQEAMQSAAIYGYTTMAGALGEALVSGEDGWKAFGQAGLNAIAGVVEAMAHEAKILAGLALAKALTGDLSQLGAAAAALGQVAAAYAAAGLIRAIPLAEGGIVMPTPGGTIARIGEGNRPEAVIPLDKMGGMGGGITQIFNIGGSVIAERQVKQLALAGMAQAGRGY